MYYNICYTSPFLVKISSPLMCFHLIMNLLHPIMKTIMTKETRKLFFLDTSLNGFARDIHAFNQDPKFNTFDKFHRNGCGLI
jgi:hypothetical protein